MRLHSDNKIVSTNSKGRHFTTKRNLLNFLLLVVSIGIFLTCCGDSPVTDQIPNVKTKYPYIYASDRDGDFDIYLDNGDNSEALNLTNNSVQDKFPVWSPDGAKIAYISEINISPSVFIMNADGSDAHQVTYRDANVQSLSWSPDSNVIAYSSDHTGNYDLFLLNITSGEEIQLTTNGCNDLHPHWSPDGTQIVFTSNRSGNYDILIFDLTSGNITQLTNFPGAETQPAWSPDGSRIAFISNREGSDDVYLMDIAGDNLQKLTQSPSMESMPSWGSDSNLIYYAYYNQGQYEIKAIDLENSNSQDLTGSRDENELYPNPMRVYPEAITITLSEISKLTHSSDIAFVSNRDGADDIYVMDANGNQISKLTDSSGNPPNDINPGWSPDGKYIVYAADLDGDFEIYLYDVDEMTHKRLTDNESPDVQPCWSGDSNQIAYVSYADGDGEICRMQKDGSNIQQLTDNDSNDVQPIWSFARNRIAFSTERDGNYEIYSMDANGNNIVRHTNHPDHDAEPGWSPDGNELVFSSDRDGDFEIYQIQYDGGAIIQLTINDLQDHAPDWSFDGKKVIFQRSMDGKDVLFIYDIENKKTEQFSPDDASGEIGPRWAPDSRTIVFSTIIGGDYEIYVRESSGESYFITDNAIGNAEPVISPDGQYIAYMCAQGSSYDICVMDRDGQNQKNITNNDVIDSSPAWSTDSNRIAFASRLEGNNDIYLIDRDGQNLERFTNTGITRNYVIAGGSHSAINIHNNYPFWSPDGKSIVFVKTDTANILTGLSSGIYIKALDSDFDSESKLVSADFDYTTLTPGTEIYANPTWSPDGSHILYQCMGIETDSDIFKLYQVKINENLEAGKPERILASFENVLNPAWSPDGSQILFTAIVGDNADIYRANADALNAIRLTTHAALDTSPSWGLPNASNGGEESLSALSIPGSSIIFTSENLEEGAWGTEIYRYDPVSGEVKDISDLDALPEYGWNIINYDICQAPKSCTTHK